MNTLGTCRTDDRQSVAAVDQTACCIVPSLPAGSCHTAIKENASFAPGETIRVRALPMGEFPKWSYRHRTRPTRSGLQPFHYVLVASLQGLRSTAEGSQSTTH